MALANLAWILAYARKNVLLIDWDLEAPGLHRYFHPFLLDKELTSTEGLMDFLNDYETEAVKPLAEGEQLPDDWYEEYADISNYMVPLNWEFPRGGGIDLVPAGKQGAAYAARVTSFDYQNFYDRLGGGAFLEAVRRRLRQQYDYILIDSRTGVSDTAGICTVQMPDDLVICFTLNNQSIVGASAIARSVYEQRRLKRGDSSFHIFPIPTRVDPFESDKLELRRRYTRWMFDPLLDQISEGERRVYWSEVEVPYIPKFAYEEVLAAFREEARDPKTSMAAMTRIARYLTYGEISEFAMPLEPQRQQDVLKQFAWTPDQEALEKAAARPAASSLPAESVVEEQLRLADTAFSRMTRDEQEESLRVMTRLVRLARPDEKAADIRLQVPITDLDANAALAASMAQQRLLVLGQNEATREPSVELASDALLHDWRPLRTRLESDREFLLWRQRLGETLHDWERHNHEPVYLLRGSALITAETHLHERPHDLNHAERKFIATSQEVEAERRKQAESASQQAAASARRQSRILRLARTLGLVVITGGLLLAYVLWQYTRTSVESQAQKILVAARAATDPLEAALLCIELKDSSEPAGWRTDVQAIASRRIPLLVLNGHRDQVSSVRFSPDGKWLVTASLDGSAIVWEAETGKQITPLIAAADNVPQRPATSIAQQTLPLPRQLNDAIFSANGALVVTGGDDGLWRTWDSRTGRLLAGVPDGRDRGPIRTLAFSPDGTLLATGGADKNLLLWLLEGERPRLKTSGQGHQSVINALTFSPDGNFVLTGSEDQTAMLWDAGSGRRQAVFRGHTAAVTSVAFSPDGKTIATGSFDRTVQFWNAQPGEPNAATYSPRQRISQTQTKNPVRIVPTALAEVAPLRQSNNLSPINLGNPLTLREAINSIAWHPAQASSLLLIGTEAPDAQLVNLQRRSDEPVLLSGHKGKINSVAFSHDGKLLATASADGTVRLWVTETRQPADNLSWPQLADYFRQTTRTCLSVEQRKRLLSENEAAAQQKYRTCEQQFGRTPAAQ